MPNKNSDNQFAKELLLEDLKYFNDSFWKNEEIGEKRVTFFIALTTALMGVLGALTQQKNPPSELTIIFALLILLVIGIVTLFRIIKRNAVTDEIKGKMDIIRDIFRNHLDYGDPKILADYYPFGKRKDGSSRHKFEFRTFGGLAHTVAALNSLIAAALAGLIFWPCKAVLKIDSFRIFLIGLMMFVITYIIQHYYIQAKDQNSKQKLREQQS